MNDNKKKDTFVSPMAGVVLLIVITLALFIAVSMFLHRAGLFHYPDFIEKMIGTEPVVTEASPGEYGSLFDSLSKNLPAKSGVQVEIDDEMLISLFISATPPAEYFQRLTVRFFSGEDEYTEYESSIRQNGDNFTVDVKNGGKSVKKVSGNASALRINDGQGGFTRSFSSDGEFSISNEAGIPDLNYVAELLSEFRSSEDDEPETVIGSCEVYSYVNENGNFLRLTFTYDDIGTTEDYIVSLDHNVIFSAESRDAEGNLLYSANTVEFTTNTEG